MLYYVYNITDVRAYIKAQLRALQGRIRSMQAHPTKTILGMSIFVVVFAVLFQVRMSGVQGAPDIPFVDFTWDSILALTANILFSLVNLMMALTIWCLKMFIALASYNEFSTAPVVEAGWVLVRDLANMFFIVALLIIAFATVLGQENYAMKKTLGKVILMAILINFSKLITQLIIDVAHVFSMTFVNAISATAGGNVLDVFKLKEIRSMAGVVQGANLGTLDSYSEIGTQLIVTAVFALAMTGIAMFSMLTYMIVLLYRMVMLWVLIILSPIAFAMQALPATQNYAKEWWSEFTKNVLSLPIMVLFMWLAFATLGSGIGLEGVLGSEIASGATTIIGTGDPTQPLTLSNATTWTNLGGFAVVIAFLFAGLEQVQKLGVKGAGSQLQDNLRKGLMFATGAAAVGFAAKGVGGMVKDTAYLAGTKVQRGVDRGLKKVPYAGKAYRGIAAMGAKRAAAVKKAQEYKEDVQAEYTKEGGGILGGLAPKTATRARQSIATENATRDSDARMQEERGYQVLDGTKKNREAYTKELEKRRKEWHTTNPNKKMSRQDESALMLDAAKEVGGDSLRAYREASASAKEGKGKTEQALIAAHLKDAQRMEDNKSPKALRLMQDADYQDDVKDFATMDFWQRKAEIQREMDIMHDLNAIPEKDRSDQEKKALKNGHRNMMNLLSSGAEQGELNDLLEFAVLPKTEGTWDNWNSDDNKQQLITAAIMGVHEKDVNTDAGMQTQSELLRGRTKEKYDGHARALRKSFNKYAADTGDSTVKDMFIEGKDEAGQAVVVLSDTVKGGARGKGKEIASGDAGTAKTSTKAAVAAKTGKDIRKGLQNFMRGNFDKPAEIKSGYGVFELDKNGKPIGFVKDRDMVDKQGKPTVDTTVEDLIDTIGDYSVSELKGQVGQGIYNQMAGGGPTERREVDGKGYIKREVEDAAGKKDIVNEFSVKKVNKLIKRKIKLMNDAGGATGKASENVTARKRQEELAELYYKFTGLRETAADIEKRIKANSGSMYK